MLLLVSLARVNLADHHKKVIWRAVVCSLVMLAIAIALRGHPGRLRAGRRRDKEGGMRSVAVALLLAFVAAGRVRRRPARSPGCG